MKKQPEYLRDAPKITQRIYAMRKAGKDWAYIARSTHLPINICKERLEDLKKEVRKDLSDRKARLDALNDPKEEQDWANFLGYKDIMRSKHPKYGKWKVPPTRRILFEKRVLSQEQMDAEREAYLEELFEELTQMGRN